jgi:hypothetical protein
METPMEGCVRTWMVGCCRGGCGRLQRSSKFLRIREERGGVCGWECGISLTYRVYR